MDRRHLLRATATAAAGVLLAQRKLHAALSAPVSIGRCGTYVPSAVTAALATMFDQLGGIARPIPLQVIDGVRTISGGEGPWGPNPKTPVAPGVLIAGTNPVATDAVAMAAMGYDPMADRGTAPFEAADSMLGLAEEAGLGTRNPKNIEVAGISVKQAMFDFAALRRARQRN